MSSETIDINEAANRMEELLQAVEKGHWIIITQDGAPVAALVPPRDWPGGRAQGHAAKPDGINDPAEDFRDRV